MKVCVVMLVSWLPLVGTLAVGQDRQPTRSEFYEVESLRNEAVSSVIERMQAERALFVFDVDNTLLQFPEGQFVGSDQWYRWQRQLAESSSARVDCILDFQGAAFYMAHLQSTENGYSTSLVGQLQQYGHDVIALTARSPEFRAATERELRRNDFEFRSSAPGGHQGFPGVYLPGRSERIQIPRSASYQNGIAMLAGQHKGDALLDLLGRVQVTDAYDWVVFFDDGLENTMAMTEAFERDSMTAIVFHYSGVSVDLRQYDLEEAERSQDSLHEAFGQFERSANCDI